MTAPSESSPLRALAEPRRCDWIIEQSDEFAGSCVLTFGHAGSHSYEPRRRAEKAEAAQYVCINADADCPAYFQCIGPDEDHCSNCRYVAGLERELEALRSRLERAEADSNPTRKHFDHCPAHPLNAACVCDAFEEDFVASQPTVRTET